MNLTPPGEHHLLVFWVQLLLLVGVARLLGQLMRRFGQPPVVGELAAGLVLGPSLLGKVAPGVFDWLFPSDEVQTAMLFTVGWLGVAFLLISTGFETDLTLIRRLGSAAALVSAGSLVIPLLLGFGVGILMPSVFIGSGDRLVFAMFMAAALSISSLPVIAKILGDMGFLRRNFGQLTLAAGMANDVVGWLLLGVIAGLAQAGEVAAGPVIGTVLGVGVFFIIAFTVGQKAVDVVLERLRRGGDNEVSGAVLVIFVALAAGAATQWLGVEAVLGAFVAGIVLGRSKLAHENLLHHLEVVTSGFFAPIFFATAGLRVDLGLLGESTVLFWAVVVVVIASVSKFAGAFAGSFAARLPAREGAALGFGLNARGALEIVIATVGLSLGVLNAASYTIVVLMAMATSLAAPPMLRAVLGGWKGTKEEVERLKREETSRRNVLVRSGRLLLPSQGEPNSIMAAQVLDLAWPAEAEVTVLTVGEIDGEDQMQPVLDTFAERPIVHKHVEGEPTVETILDEAVLGYDAIGIGARYRAEEESLLSPVVDDLVARSPIPVVVVRRPPGLERPTPPAFARAIVPVAGSVSSRSAQEIAFNMSQRLGTEVVLTHVMGRAEAEHDGRSDDEGEAELRMPTVGRLYRVGERRTTATVEQARDGVAHRLLSHADEMGTEIGARTRTLVRNGDLVSEILSAVGDEEADLVVIGASRRPLDGHLFLGHTAEELLRRCPVTVVVVATPADARVEVVAPVEV